MLFILGGLHLLFHSKKYMVGDAVAPPMRIPTTIPSGTANLTSTITFDAAPQKNAAGQDQTVVSQGLYNYSPEPPVLLINQNSYDVDASMVGKLLKAVIVVDAGGVQTTYMPYTGYVRAAYDFTSQNATLCQNTTKLNSTLASDWAKATKIDFTASLSRSFAGGGSIFSGTAAMVVAQYASDGSLKGVYKTSSNKLGGFTANSTVAITTSVPISQSPVNYVSGDNFKAFVWMSNVNTDGGFAYDLVIPFVFNANCVNKVNVVVVP